MINDFSLDNLNNIATRFTQGNGFIGVRATNEENYLEQNRGLFVSGFFNKFDSISELVNCPDVLNFEFKLNGERFCLNSGIIHNYHLNLDFSTGVLIREITWEINGEIYEFVFSRFVCFFKNIVCQKVFVKSFKTTSLEVITGIDGVVTNTGVSHLKENFKRFEDGFLKVQFESFQSHIKLDLSSRIFCSSQHDIDTYVSKRKINQKFVLDFKEVVFEKISFINEEVSYETYDELFKKHLDVYQKKWFESRIHIDSKHQYGVDFSIYHLLIMKPNDYSIGAKALSGEGYNGHIFWDSEIFLLPFYLFTDSHLAKKMLLYRFERMDEALKKALNNGYLGALFPWESALSGAEETPLYSSMNIHTGALQKIGSGSNEIHVVIDIGYAILNYFNVTNDVDFLKKYGFEMLHEICLFWKSRAVFKEGVFEILNVIGPDEYTEYIDNNAYTNYMVFKVISEFFVLAEKYGFSYSLDLHFFVNNLYLPSFNEDLIIPQDDSFLKKEIIDISFFKKYPGKQLILKKYSRDEVINLQVLKQADLIMLFFLYPNLFDSEIILKNWNYYESKTIHDSSLSRAIYGIVANQIKNPISLNYFEQSYNIDLLEDCPDGLHAANIGAVWMSVVFGFAGLSVKENIVYLNPFLKGLEFIEFNVVVKDVKYTIHVDSLKITVNVSSPCSINILNKDYFVDNSLTVSLN